MRKFITYEESIKIMNDLDLNNNTNEKLFISNALNRVLAHDITADHNSPELPTSAMDGYAIRFTDQEKTFLKIIDKNPAGEVTESKVEEGLCIKTFTGSLMPEGSDTLIPIENVEVINDEIKVISKVPLNFAKRDIGENYKKDEVLIKKGSIIGFAEIGVLASLNISQVMVYSLPIVAIACTGSEILDLGEKQTNASQIRSSNHLTIEALCKKAGAQTLQMGIVKDDINSITKLMTEGLQKADILVTTGGVSVGDYDFVQDVIKDKLQAEVLFHGVTVKPGMHILVAKKNNKLIIALPGFAYSSTVCAILYVLPLIYKLSGSQKTLPFVKARINQDYKMKMKKTIFTACNVKYEDAEYKIDFEGKKAGTSAILTNLLQSPALLMQDENSSDIKKDDLVDILLINDIK